MNEVFLLLGSNINKEDNLPAAVRLLDEMVAVTAVSAVFESAPVGLREQPVFWNAAVCVRTNQDASTIKHSVIGRIEKRLKRVRQADKNAPRTIDIDIVLFNDNVFNYEGRHIPDPDLLRFAHVAVPVADLVPERRHPETGETFQVIAARLLEQATAKEGRPPLFKRDDVRLAPPG